MTRSRAVLGQTAGVLAAVLALGGCSVHYTDLSGSAQQETQSIVWPAPKYGRWLCLTSRPGTPIYSGPSEDAAIIGYTRDVVAFGGQQTGHWISVIQYDSARIGYIDGLTIKPFHPAFSGQRCIVWEDVYHRRPLFEID